MATSSLVLHRGAQPVTEEELRQFRAPPPEGRWYPVSLAERRLHGFDDARVARATEPSFRICDSGSAKNVRAAASDGARRG